LACNVFICKCFGEIDKTIDMSALQVKLRKNTSVSRVTIAESLCFKKDLRRIVSTIKGSDVENVLIAACSPLSRGDIIRRGFEREDGNPYRVELVDIREGCAWIHSKERTDATEKAYNLIQMGLTSLENRQTPEDFDIKLFPEALILGAGPAGLSAAKSLAHIGFQTHLVEVSHRPGGMLNLISRLYPKNERASDKLKPYLDEVKDNTLIKFYPSSKTTAIEGVVGNFKGYFTAAKGDYEIRAGVIIIATGSRPVIPHSLYQYGVLKNVITQMELEKWLKGGGAVQAKKTVFIQCVGARDEYRSYCSTICCPTSLKNAMRLLENAPDSEICILHRDIMTPGKDLEEYYRTTLSNGVLFIRYDETNPPRIIGTDHVEAVEVRDVTSNIIRKIDADLVVLSTPLIPNKDNERLAGMLGLSVDKHGFFCGNEPMHPLETVRDGVFICGSARWPVSATQAIAQGKAAATKAASILSKGRIKASSLGVLPESTVLRAAVNLRYCTGCGNCVSACPYEACQIQKKEETYICVVSKQKCKGCGSCVTVCPSGAIQIPENNSFSIAEMLNKAFEKEKELRGVTNENEDLQVNCGSPKVVVFACRWCGLIGADGAGKKRITLPTSFRIITVECAARVESNFILKSLANGIDGVAVLGCHMGGCRYNDANRLAARRLEFFKGYLDFLGISGQRLLLNWGEAHEAHQFADVLNGFIRSLAEMPPMQFRKQFGKHIQ
jgi:heterodisulfide reductase subunit A